MNWVAWTVTSYSWEILTTTFYIGHQISTVIAYRDVAKLFCNCLDNNFLVQHITTPTRGDAILDLITEELYLISKILVS